MAVAPCDAISKPAFPEAHHLAPVEHAAAVTTCAPGIVRDSPWMAMHECHGLQHHALFGISAVESNRNFWGNVHWDQALGILIFATAVTFSVFSLKDIHAFVQLLINQAKTSGAESARRSSSFSQGEEGPKLEREVSSEKEAETTEWSIVGLILLTIYRFYTGFISATWLPYLLAMEGQYLWADKQALFMALAKLIYGVSILMNPMMGSIGDAAVAISHGVGRRLFIRSGLTLSAVGLYICVLSGRDRAFLSFLSGILVWRIGEALNDVTTEALVPEMVPSSQFQVASAIKASSFLLGGLLGYLLLMVLADVHYSWLYYAYPIGMFVTSLPPLYLLNQDRPIRHAKSENEDETFLQTMVQAYVAPTRYPGGFPWACLAVGIFSLGTAPMFFLLLIVRDLVGFTEPVIQQQHFSVVSIIFFLSAAASSVLVGLAQPRNADLATDDRPAPRRDAETHASKMLVKGRLLAISMFSFGLICLLMPVIPAFKELHHRSVLLTIFAVIFGAAFGAAFTLFQDLTWQLLPPGVRVANAMGFSVMSRLFGVGLGNFISGMILDYSYSSELGGYKLGGYIAMHCFSAFMVFISIPVALKVFHMAAQLEPRPQAVPAA